MDNPYLECPAIECPQCGVDTQDQVTCNTCGHDCVCTEHGCTNPECCGDEI